MQLGCLVEAQIAAAGGVDVMLQGINLRQSDRTTAGNMAKIPGSLYRAGCPHASSRGSLGRSIGIWDLGFLIRARPLLAGGEGEKHLRDSKNSQMWERIT